MPRLTIFTAAYNRGHLIERMYRALQRQSNFDFEWLVVDDGSKDNTEKLFSIWLNEDNPFKIRYYKQENKGLITTLNRGLELAEGEYFSKIDSDDYVTDDYMENVIKWLDDIKGLDNIYAVSGLKIKSSGEPLKGIYPNIPDNTGYIDATDLERSKYNLDADMSEAWRTEILRKYKFPLFEGEKFAPEQLTLYQIALDGYKIRWHKEPMCICEYQEGGLTLGANKLEKENPMGYAMMYNQKIELSESLKEKIYNASQMTALCIYAGHMEYLKQSNSKLATVLSLPFGIVLGMRRKKQFENI